MVIEDVPRTLIYKDFENINDVLVSESKNTEKSESAKKTLEREFYDKLIKRPFIKGNAKKKILTIFNNARYIYYLVKCKEDDPSLCLDSYLAKASEGTEESDLNIFITAGTMALVYSWLRAKLDEDSESDIAKLCVDIEFHFKEGENVPTESKREFYNLILRKSNLPTGIDAISEDVRNYEDAALNAPIQDVVKGLDYLMNANERLNDTIEGQHFFLKKLLNRLENDMSPIVESATIESVKATINWKLRQLEYTTKQEPSIPRLPLENITTPEEGGLTDIWGLYDNIDIGHKRGRPRAKDFEYFIKVDAPACFIEVLDDMMDGKDGKEGAKIIKACIDYWINVPQNASVTRRYKSVKPTPYWEAINDPNLASEEELESIRDEIRQRIAEKANNSSINTD